MVDSKPKNEELVNKINELENKVKILKKKKKYGLVWDTEKEPEKVVLECKDKLPILNEIENNGIVTDEHLPMNILIEGDNYHALSVLNYTHKGKVDLIYIDPPYNTGNEEFVYNDKIIDFEDSYRHSKWLSFMEKRLQLAKALLKDDGIMFISIDDNEISQLSILCKELFGEDNVEIMIWEKIASNEGKFKIVKRFRTDHEYIVVVYKNKDITNFSKVEELPDIEGKPENPDDDPRGDWISGNFSTREEKSNKESPNYYVVTSPSGKKWERDWRFSKDEFEQLNKDKRIWWGADGNNVPRLKVFVNEPKLVYISSIIRKKGTAKSAAVEVENILGKRLFEHPKPVALIKHLVKFNSKKDAYVLDFFAGSGTTGHAILDLNKEDEGNRKFILCTNNENNICSEVCYPRIKNVIKGYKTLQRKNVLGLKGNLKYFKTDFVKVDSLSNISDEKRLELTYEADEMIALRENTFDVVEKNEWWQIFKDGKKYTAIYFKEDKSKLTKLVKHLDELKAKVVLYIFSWGKNEYSDEFTEYKNIQIEDIPEPIIEVYREINKLS